MHFHVIGVFSSGFLLFLFASSSLVCVVPSSTAWTFGSDVKTLLFPGLSIRSISSGAMYQNNSSIRQFHSRFHSARYAIARIFGPLRYHCQYENIFFRYYWFCNSLLIKSSPIHYKWHVWRIRTTKSFWESKNSHSSLI